MFVTSGTHERVKSNLRQAIADRDHLLRQHNSLTLRWNDVITKINKAGGQAFLDGDVPHKQAYNTKQESQFTDAELKSILQMIHPDKQNGSAISVQLTQKINSLRK